MNIHPYHRDHGKTRTPTCTSNELINVLLALYVYIYIPLLFRTQTLFSPLLRSSFGSKNQCRIGESMGPPEGTVVIGESMPLSY